MLYDGYVLAHRLGTLDRLLLLVGGHRRDNR